VKRAARRLWNRLLGSLFGRRENDLAEELEQHIQLLTEEHIRRGLPPAEARRQARLTFGSVDSATESYRDQGGLPALDVLRHDLRYAFRGLRRNPGFSAIAILSLAIGIGANTAIFSLVNSVLLRPLAYQDPSHVFWAREVTTLGAGAVNPVHAREWARHCQSLEHVALLRGSPADLTGQGEPVAASGTAVAHNIFALLGVQPILGRAFLPEEEEPGNDRVVMLSESLWRSRYRADTALVGGSISIDRRNYRVVGILPAWFRLPSRADREVEVFRPLVLEREELARVNGNFNYNAVVRVRSNAAPERALAEMNAVQARFRRSVGLSRDLAAELVPVHELVTGRSRLGLWMLAGAVGAVLLIVCVNLANLMLSRIAARRREAAIRTALGASRGRQVRMVLTESLLLAVSGGALGLFFAAWSLDLLTRAATLGIPRLSEVRLDTTVLSFAAGLTVVCTLIFGLLPAWRLAAGDPQAALAAGGRAVTEGRRGVRLRQTLIGVEVALSAALLIVAALLTTSLSRLLQVDRGFDAGHVLTVDVRLSGEVYADPANSGRFFDRLLPNVASIAGVRAAGMVTLLPTLGNTWNDAIYLEGAPLDQRHAVDNRYASPGYFRAMSIPVLRGRFFEESDRGQHVAVLSTKAARLLWPGEANPVGRIFIGEDDKPKLLVGIVDEVRAQLQSDPPPMAYYPYWQRAPDGGSLVVRTMADPRAIAGALRAALRAEDPQLPIPAIESMDDVVDRSVAPRRFQLFLMGAFAASALLVACLGIYGVVAYSVARRQNEMGVRLALGAQRSQLLWLVLRQGMAPVACGLLAGVSLAFVLGGVIRGLLFGVQPADPLAIGAVAALLLSVGLLACYIPARRVSRADAIAALRVE
jgi:putative ABC transport system permease protein